ncbi:sugar transferase [archaeon]|nr:sugar transferase [archaeon]
MNILNPFSREEYYMKKSLGQYGKEFNLYKFKTMINGADSIKYFEFVGRINGFGKILDDERIIEERAWMRKTHFDEIPNLYNFLKGDLSFVGIRPKSLDTWEAFPKKHVKRALQFKPGLFGINYAYTNLRDFKDLIQAEEEYLSRKEEQPLKTDIEYFSKIIYNKTILGERSS